ncbi:NAD(P)-dependent dehydrogenase (short-subunit alcohol dehydrogenase family) [Bradyrhizobium liaoningense]
MQWDCEIQGCHAVVTGAGSGIGRAVALRLAEQGARVALVGRTRSKLEPVAAEFTKLGREALIVEADLRKPDAAAFAIAAAHERFGEIDLLVNNAGIYREGAFDELTDATIDDLVDIDLKGPVFMIRTAIPRMSAESCIINIASMSGVSPLHPTQTLYASVKAALIHLGTGLARELAPRRIRVNTVSPGPTRTPIIGTVVPAKDIPTIEKMIAQQIPLGRLGEAAEVAEAVTFLATRPFATGTHFVIDGGTST